MIFWRVHSVCSLCAVYIRRKRFLYACELWIHSCCCCCCCVRNRYDSDRCVDRWLWAALLLPLLHQCAFTWLPLFVIVVCMWFYFWFDFGVSASYFFAALNRWLAICIQTLSIEMELWIYQILCGCIISVSGNCFGNVHHPICNHCGAPNHMEYDYIPIMPKGRLSNW